MHWNNILCDVFHVNNYLFFNYNIYLFFFRTDTALIIYNKKEKPSRGQSIVAYAPLISLSWKY